MFSSKRLTRRPKKIGTELNKLATPAEIQRKFPHLNGSQDGWTSYANFSAGWADSGAALKRMADAAQAAGVEWITGDNGFVKQLLYDENSTCIGARAASGEAHFADLVVLSTGAAAGTLLDFKGQLVVKGHTVCHIRLSPEDHKKYANVPMINHLDGGSQNALEFVRTQTNRIVGPDVSSYS
jgi:sarcosine oxidase / L-pipecolate oxidase